MKGWLGSVRNNLESIGFGSLVPELRDRIFDVIAPKDDSSKTADTEDERKKRRRKSTASAPPGMKKGGKVGKNSIASKRADGCAVKGKTKGRMV
jgi:hypothetical protein